MKKYIVYTLLLCTLISGVFLSCENPNDWSVDDSYDAPFRPIKFEVTSKAATSVTLSYTGIIDASKYVFEFSEGDSLLFDNIVREVDILADTLTVYNDDPAPTKRTYRTLFEDFKGTTRYSVRLKGVDKSGGVTGYMETYFDTPAEQIIRRGSVGTDRVTVEWDPENEVTSFRIDRIDKTQIDPETEESDTIMIEQRNFTAEELTNGRVTVENLEMGKNYYLVLLKDETQQRGYLSFKTGGSSSGVTYRLEVGNDVNLALLSAVENGHETVTLSFSDTSQAYEIETINIPDGIKYLYVSGNAAGNAKPELYIHNITMEAPVENIYFQNIDLNARENSSNYLFNIGNTNCFYNIYFTDCVLRNIGRSLIRLNSSALVVGDIKIDNCILSNISGNGYGMFNMGSDMELNSISITNTTLVQMGEQLMDLRGEVGSVVLDKCTYYNSTRATLRVFYIRTQPGSMSVTNSIFGGTNNNTKINSASTDASLYLDFYGCYLTAELEEDSRIFWNATRLAVTAEELFVDPTPSAEYPYGNFSFNEEIRFAGEGKVGDSRWWQ